MRDTKRTATVSRKTRETDIQIELVLDGSGKSTIETGIGFFDHMLTALATHGGFDLSVCAKGDLEVDCHHTVEDVGIVLGDAFAQALGDKSGIARFGSFFVPMDETLAFCACDISGRPYLVFDADFTNDRIGEYDTCMTEEFWRAFAFHAGITLHLRVEYGQNDHHIAEALYKAAAHALRLAVAPKAGVLSTKGVLA
jgi:imidazoleglycerol-phosphate dehydratase